MRWRGTLRGGGTVPGQLFSVPSRSHSTVHLLALHAHRDGGPVLPHRGAPEPSRDLHGWAGRDESLTRSTEGTWAEQTTRAQGPSPETRSHDGQLPWGDRGPHMNLSPGLGAGACRRGCDHPGSRAETSHRGREDFLFYIRENVSHLLHIVTEAHYSELSLHLRTSLCTSICCQ